MNAPRGYAAGRFALENFVTQDREMLEELRQPYRTPSERAQDRKARAEGTGLFATMPDGNEGKIRMNVWCVQPQANPDSFVYVRCPSRSGAKIFVDNILGLKGPFWTNPVDDEELTRMAEADVEIHDPEFETVPQFAARMEAEKKERGR